MLLHRQILVPKLLHFLKKVTTLFEKVLILFNDFLKNSKVTIFFKIARQPLRARPPVKEPL